MVADKSNKIDLKPKKKKAKILEGKDNLILTLAVSITSLAIFFLWIFVLRTSWSQQESFSLDFGGDIKEILDEPVTGLDNLFKYETEEIEREKEDLAEAEKKIKENLVLDENARIVLDGIMRNAEKIIEKKEAKNCPKWVNCMPMVGSEDSSCQVPPGCEDITQIVY